MRVSVVGTGYVGLVSGACLAEKGHDVVCVDLDREKVDTINRAIPPFHERGLEDLLKKNVGRRLKASTDLRKSVIETELSLIAVGTPFNGKEIDLTYIRDASCQIGEALRDKSDYHVIAVKSTVVPGTTEGLVLPSLESTSGKKAGKSFGVGMNPEFLRQGEAVQDFMFPDRIVLGGMDQNTIHVLEELYAVFADAYVIKTSNKTAEMIKYTSNSLLATMISFSNEIGNLCAGLGNVDVVEVMKGVHLDKRLSPILPGGKRITPSFLSYLEAGCGFGGSCFPKDVKALIAHGTKSGQPMRLLDAVIKVNKKQPQRMIALLRKHYPSFEGLRVAVLGLAFKPGTDDIRESPALPVIKTLIAERALIKAYDPVAAKAANAVFGNGHITFHKDLAQVVQDVDAIVLITSWEEFRTLPQLLSQSDAQPLVIDGRRMLDKRDVTRYEGVGM